MDRGMAIGRMEGMEGEKIKFRHTLVEEFTVTGTFPIKNQLLQQFYMVNVQQEAQPGTQ